jgi:hypothetical protein
MIRKKDTRGDGSNLRRTRFVIEIGRLIVQVLEIFHGWFGGGGPRWPTIM